ncbi:MAG: 3-hydroxyacyl-CoA dehydrogenase/enoyl-CoA hydratase family protein [Desulfobacterota bacterium]|nr:3-hydroxyacyl-CoA dehydrogenase/enoyl-CoA hydratase family protein [Thermodesulfobacteriota bacterium]
MRQRIRKAAVLGAGVMGSAIAAHLANVGIPSFLLDIVPSELSEAEKKKGLTTESPEFRNRFSIQGKKNIQEIKPAPLYLKEDAELITVGNFEDHLSWISEADWVIEAIVENLNLKRELFRKALPFLKERTVISSNTSGISIQKMCEGFPSDFEERFLGTHFFNPPRYMKLLEIIPARSTSKAVLQQMAEVGEKMLGKGVVFAKDTPNFIGNRIGAFAGAVTMRIAMEEGYLIEEIDQVTGPAIGRTKLATYKLADLVGLDVMSHVSKNLYENLSDEKEKEFFKPSPLIEQMIKNQWLGQKTKQGFYKRIKERGREETLVLDYEKMEYRPQKKVTFPSVEACKNIEDVRERLRTMVNSPDRGGQLAWKILKKTFLYAAEKAPEISDDIVSIDRAMRWGYNWELGPFEQWDAIGLKPSVERMAKEGEAIPPLVERLLGKGYSSFYEKKEGRVSYFDFGRGQYQILEEKPEIILLSSLKERQRTVLSNPGASLIDLGDGVACLEFHSKMNTIGADTIQMIRDALKEVEEKFEGLVIGNQAENFSVGANLMLLLFEIQDENWDDIDLMVKAFQDALMAVKYFEKPVVAAPLGMTLAGGCEICLACCAIRAAAETYMGLVEVGVGLIPAGGGTKEMLLRSIEHIPPEVDADHLPFVRRAFETVAMAKVSTSAKEAQKLGYMRPTDRISINRDYLIHDAKQTVLQLVKENYRPPRPKKIKVMGERGLALMKMGLFYMREGGYISEYDEHIAKKVAYIMSGGNLPDGTEVTEQYLLDLEREAFLSLCGEAKTQERIEYMLKTGKPLRN